MCSGIERLCVCADSGKVKFFDIETIGDEQNSVNSQLLDGCDSIDGSSKKSKFDEDSSESQGIGIFLCFC